MKNLLTKLRREMWGSLVRGRRRGPAPRVERLEDRLNPGNLDISAGGAATFVANPGEINDIRLSLDTVMGQYTFTDNGAVITVSGAGAAAANAQGAGTNTVTLKSSFITSFSIDTVDLSDFVTILSTGVPTTIMKSGSAANDTITLGNNGSVQGITGPVQISNANSLDTVLVDDSADATGRTVTLGDTTVHGLAPADITYDSTAVGDVNGTPGLTVNGGTGGNNFTVTNTIFNSTTALNAGAGNDTVTVQAGAAGSTLNVDGQGGMNLFKVTPSANATFNFNNGASLQYIGPGMVNPNGANAGTVTQAGFKPVTFMNTPVANVVIVLPPVANAQTVNVPQNASNFSITVSASDPNNPVQTPLAFAVVQTTAHGTLTQAGAGSASFKYTPNPGFTGSDSFTFQATNQAALVSNVATVTINVVAQVNVTSNAPPPPPPSARLNGTTLVVTAASPAGDVILFLKGRKKGVVTVVVDGAVLGSFRPRAIVAIAGGGGSLIAVDRRIKLPASLFGGPGNDVLIGGGGFNLLDGEGGVNTLVPGPRRNVLIGGGPGSGVAIHAGPGDNFIEVARRGGPVPMLLVDQNGQVSAFPYLKGSTVSVFGDGGTDVLVADASLRGHWKVTLHGGRRASLLFDRTGEAVLDGGGGTSLLDGIGGDQLLRGIGVGRIADPSALGAVIDALFMEDQLLRAGPLPL